METFDGMRPGGQADALRGASGILKEDLGWRIRFLEDFMETVTQIINGIDRSETELEDTLRRLCETQNQLIQSMKLTLLGELAAALAHELNQPLTVIKGLSQNLLKSSVDGSPVHEKMRLVAESAKKMECVINHLRVFSRREGPEMNPVDLNQVVRDAFFMLRELLGKHSIEVELELPCLPKVAGSANRLEQVIVNLVANAKDAMPDGGKLKITTSVVEENGQRAVRVSIRDSGAGMPPEILSKAFEPFFTTKEAGKGTGLGLYICSGIVKEHNGSLSVESSAGKGTAFHITIPVMD